MQGSAARTAYVGNAIATASPARLLVMLCDRLVLDVERAARAQVDGDRVETHNQLVHAQAIVTELRSSLRPEGWRGGAELASLYAYLDRRLVEANTHNDRRATAEALGLCRSIRDTWREAAMLAAGLAAGA